MARKTHSVFDSSLLQHLHLAGAYVSDAPLRLPSLFVLELRGSLTAALALDINVIQTPCSILFH